MKRAMRGLILFLFLFLIVIRVVKGWPREDLICGLPGQPDGANTSFRQFSGYVNVGEQRRHHLFYYFAEGPLHNHSLLPLTLWLNGGPGCSSVGGGAFTELGPFFPNNNNNGQGLVINPHAWNKVANILFVESPLGVGFSYSDNASDYHYDDAKVAKDNLAFLLGWLEKFPEYKNSDLYLAGESYAGHYIPQLAARILYYNKGSNGFKFKLKGVAIGNPLLNFGADTAATYTFLWSHGLISDHTYAGIHSTCDFSAGYPRSPSAMDALTINEKECSSFIIRGTREMGKHIDNYDVTLDVCTKRRNKSLNDIAEVDVCMDREITKYLNRKEVRSALHVSSTDSLSNSKWQWRACSSVVSYDFEDQLQDMVPVLKTLVKEGLRVWIYSGDQDSVVPLTGTRTQIDQLATSCNMRTSGSYRAWYANNQVGGWTQSYGANLTYATVRGASHMVPYTQPVRALVLFTSFINGIQLPRPKDSK